MPPSLVHMRSSGGAQVFGLPLEVFPKFIGYAYVVVSDDKVYLIDSGSGLGASNDDLLAGFAALRSDHGLALTLGDIDSIIITHAHIDHFGGLQFVRDHTDAPITMHALDQRVITNYEGRLLMASKSLSLFLQRSGVEEAERTRLLQMYGWSKGMFHALPVAETVEHGAIIDERFRVFHAPGHCPGQICLQLDDIFFSADHVLSRTSPHLAPESITPGTGLEHYISALRAVSAIDGVRVALGGHEDPISDLRGRSLALIASHERKLERLLELLKERPRTVAELTKTVHPSVDGYDVLLALEQVGAHVEYLYLRGIIRPTNLDPGSDDTLAALRYEIF